MDLYRSIYVNPDTDSILTDVRNWSRGWADGGIELFNDHRIVKEETATVEEEVDVAEEKTALVEKDSATDENNLATAVKFTATIKKNSATGMDDSAMIEKDTRYYIASLDEGTIRQRLSFLLHDQFPTQDGRI